MRRGDARLLWGAFLLTDRGMSQAARMRSHREQARMINDIETITSDDTKPQSNPSKEKILKQNRLSDVLIVLSVLTFAFVTPLALAEKPQSKADKTIAQKGPMQTGLLQVTGTLGSPNATTTIEGNQLPAPDPKFGGVVNNDALQSKPWWAPRIVPPKEAPNVLLIITDDAGFGVPSTFGGVIPTPTMDRIANNGLRYNNIHSTALCSPTRAALITGRNHHSAGFGVISEPVSYTHLTLPTKRIV